MTTKLKATDKKGSAIDYKSVIFQCLEIIRTFNPITHSVDTICLEKLGDTTKPVIFLILAIIT
jgi:hypothetical protein